MAAAIGDAADTPVGIVLIVKMGSIRTKNSADETMTEHRSSANV